MTYGSVLVGPESLDMLRKSIHYWFTKKKHKQPLFLYGPCGSGKTQLLKQIIPGSYLADEDTTPVNDLVTPDRIPIYNYTRGLLNKQALPMQVFESTELPSAYEREHYFKGIGDESAAMLLTTNNCIPSNQMLDEYIRAIMTSLKITNDPNNQVIVNIQNGDVRAEITRIEYQLTQVPTPNQASRNYMSTRMNEIVRGSQVDITHDYHILQTCAKDYLDPYKWTEMNSLMDTLNLMDDDTEIANTMYNLNIPDMIGVDVGMTIDDIITMLFTTKYHYDPQRFAFVKVGVDILQQILDHVNKLFQVQITCDMLRGVGNSVADIRDFILKHLKRTRLTVNKKSTLPPYKTLYTWNLVYKYKSLWMMQSQVGKWELYVNDNISSDDDIIQIVNATFEDIDLYYKQRNLQERYKNEIKVIKRNIYIFWLKYIKSSKKYSKIKL